MTPTRRRVVRAAAAAVLALVSGVAAPVSAGTGTTTPTDEPGCGEPHPAFTHDHTNGATLPQTPEIAGESVPYQFAGATVTLIEQRATSLVFSVTMDGTTHVFTTAPFPPGSHYPNRSPGADDTMFGTVDIVTASTGAVYVVLSRFNSGTADRYGWRFDDPCAVPSSVAEPAEAAVAVPTYTG